MTNIELVNLKKTYPGGETPVLNHLSLTIHSGEMMALLGPSGSGKSTILKLITGIETPDEGDILFDGESILPIAPNKRGAILMFQKAYLFPFLSVEDNIGFGMKVRGDNAKTIRAEVRKMLDLIGLPGFEKRKPSQLSGGEQQRVALARALVLQPRSMLLDEPLSSLDTEVRVNLQEAIRRIQRELGITTILVTHDLNEAMGMADRVALLLDGQVAAVDQPMHLYARPPTKPTSRFVGITTFLEGELKQGHLATEQGTLTVNTNRHQADSAVFAIRPEHIRVQKEPGQNSMAGLIAECIFRGDYIEYQVAVDKQTSIRARVPMPAPLIEHGQQVYICFPPEYLFEVEPN
jgi:ABC-type Fe3+/spermidine/putrescine transport system ATPase subunit